MTVIFGTLGFTPGKLVPSLRTHEGVSKLVFYHDHHENSVSAAATVRKACHEYGLAVEGVALDAFDIIECALRMRRDLRREGPEQVVFNVTGGTPVISSAATLACILEGVRAVYLDERDQEEKALPLLSMRYEEVLKPEPRRVLEFIADAGKAGCTQADVMRVTGLTRGTVSHHVKNLKLKQLVEAVQDPRDHRKETLRVRESAALLLMRDPA